MSKRALLVGINVYPGCPLQGCVNDVLNMETFLQTQGFETKHLLDREATTKNITTELKALVKWAQEGDSIIFHYSGHGSQVPDRNGIPDESEGLDEIICPIDIDFYSGRYITDDQLHAIFGTLPTGVLAEVILDCCHSGSGLRDIHPDLSASRFMPAPTDLLEKRVLEERELVILDPSAQNTVVLWAACRSTETAADAQVGSTFNGAFTYSFLNTLNQGNFSREVIEANTQNFMRSRGWPQNPQLECTDIERTRPFLA